MRPHRVLAALSLVSVSLLSACGSDSAESAPSSETAAPTDTADAGTTDDTAAESAAGETQVSVAGSESSEPKTPGAGPAGTGDPVVVEDGEVRFTANAAEFGPGAEEFLELEWEIIDASGDCVPKLVTTTPDGRVLSARADLTGCSGTHTEYFSPEVGSQPGDYVATVTDGVNGAEGAFTATYSG